MLIASAKIPAREESISQTCFYEQLPVISHTFYSPIYPLEEGNEDVPLV